MRSTRLLLAATCLATLPASAGAQTRDPLAEAFRDPPAEARPRVWWHWMNGNVTEEGIARDLAWMKRVGIAGLQNFDANLKTPQVVDKRLVYMTPEWKRAFRFAATEADRLALELAIAASPGWSETGGPWVTPEDAMKKLVWSETFVRAGQRTAIRLADPARVAGPFGNLPIQDQFGLAEPVEVDRPAFYRDVAVLAWPVAAPVALPAPRMTAGDGKPLDVATLGDGDLTTGVTISRGTRDDPAAITIEYPAPQTVRSLVVHVPGAGPTPVNPGLRPRLEASDDGRAWRPVTELAMTDVPSTVSFDPVTASRFRIVFASARSQAAATAFMPPPGLDLSALAGLRPTGSPGLEIEELRLGAETRINQFESKAGFATSPDYYALDARTGGDIAGPSPREVLDVTARLKADGTLDWTPPKGDWRVVRLGWSLTGKTNHPATAEATGLEVDKMDAGAVRRYLDRYLAQYRDAAGNDLIGARGVRALLTDST
jgi:hypothetical protein